LRIEALSMLPLCWECKISRKNSLAEGAVIPMVAKDSPLLHGIQNYSWKMALSISPG
jgi:hypothetical protein